MVPIPGNPLILDSESEPYCPLSSILLTKVNSCINFSTVLQGKLKVQTVWKEGKLDVI